MSESRTVLHLRFACVTAAGLLALLVDVAAQQTPSKPEATFKSGVDIVHVDVSVLDKDRHPVQGLSAADFVWTRRRQSAAGRRVHRGRAAAEAGGATCYLDARGRAGRDDQPAPARGSARRHSAGPHDPAGGHASRTAHGRNSGRSAGPSRSGRCGLHDEYAAAELHGRSRILKAAINQTFVPLQDTANSLSGASAFAACAVWRP